ncbi:uncharacterized protein APUU_51274S [Aspergillus puulaauensis]|uniref:Uncharacterized protein n=1 Tax=Aspergillus puulaauensis TaxID=1220207 RepID=A0A7R7XTG0_9EURO|nr:uncharacterized protein APUU_51274S [Aspergillus puulaauensis]BCS26563.1 hypothetical protein APUU_51274S [Aspergillus puulaauensis]
MLDHGQYMCISEIGPSKPSTRALRLPVSPHNTQDDDPTFYQIGCMATCKALAGGELLNRTQW